MYITYVFVGSICERKLHVFGFPNEFCYELYCKIGVMVMRIILQDQLLNRGQLCRNLVLCMCALFFFFGGHPLTDLNKMF